MRQTSDHYAGHPAIRGGLWNDGSRWTIGDAGSVPQGASEMAEPMLNGPGAIPGSSDSEALILREQLIHLHAASPSGVSCPGGMYAPAPGWTSTSSSPARSL